MWWYIGGFVLVFCMITFEYSYKEEKLEDDEIGTIWVLAFMSWAGVAILISSYIGDYFAEREKKEKR